MRHIAGCVSITVQYCSLIAMKIKPDWQRGTILPVFTYTCEVKE